MDIVEMRRVTRRLFFQSWGGWLLIALSLAGLVAAIVIGLSTKETLAAAVFALIWAAFLARTFGPALGIMGTRLDQLSARRAPVTYEFSNDGISYAAQGGPVHIEWRAIGRVRELPEGYLLYRRPRPLYLQGLVPRRRRPYQFR